jgi:ABC-type multidrug transport system ATPase subunit
MISLRNVRFRYVPSVPVIDLVELDLHPGLTLVLGPNGCGKSTLMKIMAGVEKPDEGHVSVNGVDLWVREVQARQLITYVPEHPDITPYANIEEVLLLVCRLRGVPLERAEEVARRAGIHAYRKHSIRELSQGQRRRVLIAAAWIGSPQILVLDEPLEAMDRAMRNDIQMWIRRNVETERTIVLSTHTIEDFAELASGAVTLRDGKVQSWDTLPDEPESRYSFLAAVGSGAEVRG